MKKQINPNIQAHLLQGTFYVLLLVTVCAIPFALGQPNATKPEASTKLPQRTLTFEERVSYQRAIEDVYWRHRIWPKERPDSKPALDAVMSQAQLEKKVEGYLRNSQTLEEYRQRPLTADQLQAEMERMAEHTRQPDVLHELFAALGNDPFLIAECLARPVLSARLNVYVNNNEPLEATRAKDQIPDLTAAAIANYTLPPISDGPSECMDDTWTSTDVTNAPAGRDYHTAVWTGSEMIVWGGYNGSGNLNTGGRYNPSTDSWTATSTANAPSARNLHTAVWTGSEMIVWGGHTAVSYFSNTGGRYNPITDSWTATSTTDAPAGRKHHTVVWTGSEMIVWGGCTGVLIECPNIFNTGGRYNPSTDSWSATSTTNAPNARSYHTAVWTWTGGEMIVWGGNGGSGNTGGKYNPSTDSWTATSTANAPSARYLHTAVWTDSEMIVWGGLGAGFLNTGGKYDPSTDSWTTTSTTNTPAGRWFHTAVWTGNEMIVWGGDNNSGLLNTGGRYSPGTDGWTATSTTSVPSERNSHTAVWTGSQMIVWGGNNDLNTGGKYCAQSGPTPTPTPTPTATATPTATPTPTSTARPSPAPRPRPTPAPRSVAPSTQRA